MHRYWILLALIGTVITSCSIPLGNKTQPTSLSVRFDQGSRAVSSAFAAWTIAGTNADGTSLPTKKFTTMQGQLNLNPGTWTFSVAVLDSSDAIVQTGGATAVLEAGKVNTVTFALDPAISVNIGVQTGPQDVWQLTVTGDDIDSWPMIEYPYSLHIEASPGFDSYTWYLDSELQPESLLPPENGMVWDSPPVYTEQGRLGYGGHSILFVTSKNGQVYSQTINFYLDGGN